MYLAFFCHFFFVTLKLEQWWLVKTNLVGAWADSIT